MRQDLTCRIKLYSSSNMRVAVALATLGDQTVNSRREQIVPLSERDKNGTGRLHLDFTVDRGLHALSTNSPE
ncbi:hypothetical protein [Rhizobium sp. LjRoot98]|uniref:hypothetical protein n=1 Tax=Rhizobium sp. LjRoot98 TaxID=3342345 RepID=UPI003F501306